MKASPRQQQLLLELQTHDHSLARLQRKRVQLPQRAELAGMQSQTQAVKERFMTLQRELDAQQADIARLESDVEMVTQRIGRDHALLSESSSPKEAQALQHELDTLARRRNELEDRELALLEANEQTRHRYDEASAELATVETRESTIRAELTQAEAKLDQELARVAEERAGLAAEVQRDLLEHYEALRARLGVAVARLRGNVSEASNMELAPAELSDILTAPEDELQYCPQTGAILIRGSE